MPGQPGTKSKTAVSVDRGSAQAEVLRGKEACLQFTSGVGTFPLEDVLGDGGQLSGFLGAQELKRV